MNNKFLNIKVSKSFYDKLMEHPIYQKNWKAISPALYFLNRLVNYQYQNDNKNVEFYSGLIRDIFKPYTNGAYAEYIDALVELGLLELDGNFISKNDAPDGIGHCMSYGVTDLAQDLLSDCNVEYLRKLYFDKDQIRKNQRNISKRKARHRKFDDPISQQMYDLMIKACLKYEDFSRIWSESSKYKKHHIEQFATKIQTKDISDPSYNESDGRLSNDYSMMSNTLKNVIEVDGSKRAAVVDIRACYPTFFSTYIYDYFTKYCNVDMFFVNGVIVDSTIDTKYSISLYSNPNPTPTLPLPPTSHYVGNKVDISCFEYNKEDRNTSKVERLTQSEMILAKLNSENSDWIRRWTDKDIDPRIQISIDLGKDKEWVKQSLNETLNGSKKYPSIQNWLKSNYPILYYIWQSTDIKKTGPNIGKEYEAKLMLNSAMYDHAAEMGLVLGYEYDGFSVYAPKVTGSLISQVKMLVDRVRWTSRHNFGFECVIKVDYLV